MQLTLRNVLDSARHILVAEYGAVLMDGTKDMTDIINKVVDGITGGREVEGQSPEEVREYVKARIIGLGPADVLLKDPEVSEIMINGPKDIFIERNGVIEKAQGVEFENEQEVMDVLDRIVRRCGRKINYSDPTVDARLGEMRVNAVIKPCASVPYITIRRFVKKVFSTEDFLKTGYFTEEIAEVLRYCVIGKANILVAGATGCGKTTFMRWLCEHIPENERLITIEDTKELNLAREHLVSLETNEKADAAKLIINTLRMRPDRILLGEIRGAEALELLNAMGTGHEGSISSIHTNLGNLSAIQRFVRAAARAGTVSPEEIQAMISEILNLIIFLKRFPDGTRRLVSISQVLSNNGKPAFRDIYKYSPGRGHRFIQPLSEELLEILSQNFMEELPKLPAFTGRETPAECSQYFMKGA
ncbi:CpaF family protein [Desulforamulus putei]|uniref:CpaF family protein n=1 Tax=Desulforamulus putei TaxID=74701 RepID=UPI002FDD1156